MTKIQKYAQWQVRKRFAIWDFWLSLNLKRADDIRYIRNISLYQ